MTETLIKHTYSLLPIERSNYYNGLSDDDKLTVREWAIGSYLTGPSDEDEKKDDGLNLYLTSTHPMRQSTDILHRLRNIISSYLSSGDENLERLWKIFSVDMWYWGNYSDINIPHVIDDVGYITINKDVHIFRLDDPFNRDFMVMIKTPNGEFVFANKSVMYKEMYEFLSDGFAKELMEMCPGLELALPLFEMVNPSRFVGVNYDNHYRYRHYNDLRCRVVKSVNMWKSTQDDSYISASVQENDGVMVFSIGVNMDGRFISGYYE